MLFDERPIVTAVVGSDDDTIAGAEGICQIRRSLEAFAINADACNMGVVEGDACAFFAQEMNDIERW